MIVSRSASFVALAISLVPVSAWAQQSVRRSDQTPVQTTDPSATSPEAETAEIVVTGSLIAGTPEDAALPVDVIDAAALERRGAPTVLDIIRTLPAIGSVLGEANATNAAAIGNNGSASVNLRGLGANRTLVLLNGRRLAGSANGTVDANLIPLAAIGRLEVLKDGAAATYGSDAIGGVVNFITRKPFNGIELTADHSLIEGSDGDTNLGANAGYSKGPFSILISAGYQRRSEINMRERDFTIRPYLENPQGGFSTSGSPGTFQRVDASGRIIAGPIADPQCAALGNVQTSPSTCLYTYTPFQSLVDSQTRYQFFGSAEYDVSPSLTAHLEGLYSHTEVETPISPSLIPSGFPTGALLRAGAQAVPNRYVIPCANPGLQNILAQNPAFASAIGGAGCTGAGGVPADSFTAIAAWRPYGVGGNPFTGYAKDTGRKIRAYRISGGLSGKIGANVNWDVAVTHMDVRARSYGSDLVINRLQLALAGFGGPNCTGSVPGANGCQWFNPFSNAIQGNVTTGAPNAQYSSAVANSRSLAEWLEVPTGSVIDNKLTTYDAVLSGKLPFLELPGGRIGWAVGAQYRRLSLDTDYNDFNNAAVYPCIDSPMIPTATCTVPRGPLNSTSASLPVNLDQNIKAVFGELQLPITRRVNAQLAIRHEAYSGGIGSTTNPKLALKWELFDGFALRGSIGTTFRGPTASDVDPSPTTTLSPLTAAGGTSRQIDFFGNPGLSPETATSANFGAIVERGPFTLKVDYWRFDFKSPIVRPPFNAIASSVVPTANGPANCAAALRSRIVFDNGDSCVQGVTTGANILRVRADLENGPKTKVDGIDFDASLGVPVGSARVTLSGSGSYLLNYKVGATEIDRITVASGYSAAGFLNEDRGGALPRFRGYGRVDLTSGIHSLGLGLRYTSRYRDERTAIFTAASPEGRTIAQRALVDLTYVLRGLPATLSFSVNNVLNKQPAFARTVYSYDTFTGDPLGRVFKFGIRRAF